PAEGPTRQRSPEPCRSSIGGIGWPEEEPTRRGVKWHGANEPGHGKQSAFAEERNKLVGGADERDKIDERQRALEQQPRRPIAGEPVSHDVETEATRMLKT